MAVPKLRFKADNGSEFPEWEEKRLGDVGAVAMCKRVFKEQTSDTGEVPFFKIGTFGGKPDAYISYALFKELKEKHPYPKKGTVLLSASGTVGRQVMYNGENAYYQDSNIVWLEHDDTVIDGFLNQFYSIVKWKGLEGSTIKRLYNKTILDTVFYRPSLPEQKKIASFLSTIDEIIQSTESELTAWQERKKGVMQKIFNREVRFKADDGSEFPEWEEKRLGDVAVVTMGQSPDSVAYNTDGIGLPLVQGNADMTNRVTTPSRYTSQITKTANNGDILMSVRAPVGVVGLVSLTVCCGRGVCIFRPYDDYCHDYVYELLLSLESSWEHIAQGGIFTAISKEDICCRNVLIPSLPEQRKIADCLSSLDDAISNIRAEFSAWKEFKKGLLQQMFV